MSNIDVREANINDLQAWMTAGEISAESLVEAYLKRIEEIDRQGPALNSVLTVNPDAVAIAQDLDRERERSGPRGRLHGIPIILKDNIDTADKMATTAGSLALAGSKASQDAFLVARLREAGAVILAKSNLSEWANFRGKRSTSGWSSLGGQVRNPYALDRNPCGSSSGSGVAASASLCAAAIGTETAGSIVCPSHANGIVGIKPTVGLVSRSGIIPISHSQDTAGPMARTVADAAVLLGALTGVDPRDEATLTSEGKAFKDYTPFLDARGLQGAKIGVARGLFGYSPKVDAVTEKALEVMKKEGAEIIDPIGLHIADATIDADDLHVDDALDGAMLELFQYEYKAGLNAYLAGRGPDAQVHNVSELILFNQANKDRVMPYFGQEWLSLSQEKGALSDEAYLEARETCLRLARDEGIDAIMAKYDLDAIVGPTGGPAWPTDPLNGDHFVGSSSRLAAVAGYPHITVPAGAIFGLPVGISFFAGAYQEPNLIKIAYAFERATRARRPPRFLPTIEL